MLGENIKLARETKGMTQQQLAERLHVVRQTVSKWEKNLSVPDADLLKEISILLDVDIRTLLDETYTEAECEKQKGDFKMKKLSTTLLVIGIAALSIIVALTIWGILFSKTGIIETTTDVFVTPI
jgi:transcriptional regulator with XRE-family HTH domain